MKPANVETSFVDLVWKPNGVVEVLRKSSGYSLGVLSWFSRENTVLFYARAMLSSDQLGELATIAAYLTRREKGEE